MSEQKNPNQPKKKLKPKHILGIVILVLVIFIIGLFAWAGGFEALKQSYKMWSDSKKAYEATKKFEEGLKQYYKVLEEDTYGGKTPQETLDMFISALEKGDIDLAAKYFALDDNLSRKEWEDGLKKAKEEGEIPGILLILKEMQPAKEDHYLKDEFEFLHFDKNTGLVDHTVYLQFNEYSKVWKIKSM